MSTGETVVNSYDAGYQPYIHDSKRGKWEGRWDFYLACFANALGLRTFFLFGAFIQICGGVYIVLPILLGAVLYIIPVFFVQSFMGQFSATGFISVFRISPLFKGIGYVILVLNFTSVVYSSSIAAFPFLFVLKSFQTNATWMYCGNSWNTENCSEKINKSTIYPYDDHNLTDSLDPQYEYYYHEILKLSHDPEREFATWAISWTVVLGLLFIWIIVGCVVFRGISMVGKFIRYCVITASVLGWILFIRVCFLPEIGEDTMNFLTMETNKHFSFVFPWIVGPLIAASVLGRGWGIVLTMASFQKFRANTERYSFVITLLLLTQSVLFGYMITMVDKFISRRSSHTMMYFDPESVEYLFVVIPYFCGKLEASQMWSMIFFLMLFISELTLIVIQVFAIVTSLTDEYVHLRDYKIHLAVGLCAVSFVCSIFFATEYLVEALKQLVVSGYANQMVICFMEIMIVVWIYGRERFIRDVRFMLVENTAPWKFYIIRFVTPIFVILNFLFFLGISIVHMHHVPRILEAIVIFLKGLPWVFIPGYVIVKLVTSIGTFSERFSRCTRPNDWYPADPHDKHKYELALGTTDISQQLLEMSDNNVE